MKELATITQIQLKYAEDYFNTQKALNKPFSVSGLAKSLNLSTKKLKELSDHDEKVSKIMAIIEQQLEEKLLEPKAGQIEGPKFILKNQFGWSEKVDLDIKGQVNVVVAKFDVSTLADSPFAEPLKRLNLIPNSQ